MYYRPMPQTLGLWHWVYHALATCCHQESNIKHMKLRWSVSSNAAKTWGGKLSQKWLEKSRLLTSSWCQDDYIILKKNILGSGYNGKARFKCWLPLYWEGALRCRMRHKQASALKFSFVSQNVSERATPLKFIWFLFLVFRKKTDHHQ